MANKDIANWVGYFLAACLIIVLIWIVAKQIKEHHLQDDPMLYTLKEVLLPVHPIIGKLKLYKGDKSYTINKEKIFLCLRDENGEYYPFNMLIYVLLHEISHMLNTDDVGHTPAFHKKFDELLDRATQLGIFNPSIPILQNYCQHD
uniref:WLM domain-containing protein n=1 Tax=viral metagenome TaxID=1070528 RepID=A0A6C0EQM8_9ZZZZ